MRKFLSFKRLISVFAVVTILLSLVAVPAFAGSAFEAKNSVVAIESPDGGMGTGFAVGKVGKPVEYIVTNNHVVNGEVNTMATVYFNLAANKMMLAKVFYYNVDKDIAILKLPEPTTEREPLVICDKAHLKPDDDFYALGYPGTSLEITEWLQFSPQDITTTRGGIKKNDTFGGVDVYYLDLVITHGNSGGPLVNSRGEVVGINRGAAIAVEHQSLENQAIVIDELVRILESEKIPYAKRGDVNWLFIVAGVVLIAIIVLVIILIVRKKGNGGNGGMVENPTMPIETNNQTRPVEAPAAEKNVPTARVIAIGGTLNGKRYSVSGPVKIGRDSSKCGIAFPVNTQGVSGVHCEIGFDGAVCYVKDLGSSYGTYTLNGEKLAANVPKVLKSGDKFYLASPDNTFEVRF